MVHAIVVHRNQALVEQGFQCAYCHAPLTYRKATADHRWPVSRGGSCDRYNIGAACRRCNRVKGEMSDVEFYRLIGRSKPKFVSIDILIIWMERRIWKRTHRACERLLARAR